MHSTSVKMIFKRLRHELNKLICYVKTDCAIGQTGDIKELSAGNARLYSKEVFVIPPIRKLIQHEQVYTILGYPMSEIVPYMQNKRREHIKRLGKVVPQWKKLSQRYEMEDNKRETESK
eukprot:NODE_669_length_5359_cov_0.427376.p5 type:complete len:119 gc:universal NODE_669_length_5359_cov_0.427376:2498-2854(+)